MTPDTKGPAIPDDKNTGSANENSGLEENFGQDGENDITPAELELLDEAGNSSGDELPGDSRLDDTDEDGDKLNEEDDLTGEDLDVPGSEADDENEVIGEEDEENNSYSISQRHDDSDPFP